MLGQNTPWITVTFALAILGYLGLTSTVVIAARTGFPRRWWRIVVAIIVSHVTLVWSVRYGGDFSLAIRNGYFGFILFHSALAMIMTSLFLPVHWARPMVDVCFLIVSAGALGAVFIYEVVDMYRLPVIGGIVVGGWYLVSAYWPRFREVFDGAK